MREDPSHQLHRMFHEQMKHQKSSTHLGNKASVCYEEKKRRRELLKTKKNRPLSHGNSLLNQLPNTAEIHSQLPANGGVAFTVDYGGHYRPISNPPWKTEESYAAKEEEGEEEAVCCNFYFHCRHHHFNIACHQIREVQGLPGATNNNDQQDTLTKQHPLFYDNHLQGKPVQSRRIKKTTEVKSLANGEETIEAEIKTGPNKLSNASSSEVKNQTNSADANEVGCQPQHIISSGPHDRNVKDNRTKNAIKTM